MKKETKKTWKAPKLEELDGKKTKGGYSGSGSSGEGTSYAISS